MYVNDTQPNKLAETRPARLRRQARRGRRGRGCSFWLALSLLALIYMLAPLNSNILILGIDRAPEGTVVGRSDTNIIVGINPLTADVQMLSIPRDLWVTIPGYGEDRINAAHVYGEIVEVGGGTRLMVATVETNFGVGIDYTVRIQLENFAGVVDALGGVDLELDSPMGGYPAGEHHLDGTQALAFVRDRAGTDDFFRMQQGQVMIKALFGELLNPLKWLRIPAVLVQIFQVVESDIPWWQWPRLGLALLRAGPGGIENRTLDRNLATPFTTAQGADVLLPNWELIRPMIKEMFGS